MIPVKPASLGKSRLHVPGIDRAAIARAMAMDTIEAASQVADVVLVTADPALRPAGVTVVREGSPAGLDHAICLGLAQAPPNHRAVLLGDLPGLLPEDLEMALRLADEVPLGRVPDEQRVGTTMVTARAGPLRPQFGVDSWQRHGESGFVELPLPEGSTLHRDVDTADHLTGRMGPRTTAVLTHHAQQVAPVA